MKNIKVKIEKIKRLFSQTGFSGGLKVLAGYAEIYIKSFFVSSGDVLFVTSGVGDSAKYRAYNIAEELRLHGIVAVTTISDNPNLPALADKFKIFIFHRTNFTSAVEKLIARIKEQKKEIIFDTDDLVYDGAYLSQMDYFQKMGEEEQKLYKNGIGAEIVNDPYVAVCTTTVSYLADKLREKNKKVFVVENKFSNHELLVTQNILDNIPKQKDTAVRLGYFSGTASHNQDFATITPALIQVLEKYRNVKLFLAGPLEVENNLNKFKDRIVILPFVPRDKYYENIWKVDIALAPLVRHDQFCESKSAIKFSEAGILKIPMVAVKNQTFSESIQDGVDGFLAGDTAEWVEKLGKLIENSELRKNMGEKAREKVLDRYINKNSHAEDYYAYLKQIIEK